MTNLYTLVNVYSKPLPHLDLCILSTYFSTAYQPTIDDIFVKNTTCSRLKLATHKMLDKLYCQY